ncbi:hypothetical protein FDP41_008458 [Naegleria fowleri]|uniref:Uncharacterized protein n=1 Tax=Naegleria fowleri TaxID=5763 RepID=A0A6A5BFH8_NAEFO|nr:uncharacterized protein FDP41_008458 [Naegleria fowleri]KAF0973251.1 hypothetical protein FDP41_008458 [Naegleria fowleri]
MRYDNNYAGSALNFEHEAYQLSVALAFRNTIGDQSSCSLLTLEIEQLHSIVSSETIFKNRLLAINQLIERKEAYALLLEVACDHYRTSVSKYHKKPNFHEILEEDFGSQLAKLNESKYYACSLIGSSHSSTFSLIFKRIYLETVLPNIKFSLIEKLPSNIVLPFPPTHFYLFEQIIDELHTFCDTNNHSITFESEHGLLSYIAYHYESTTRLTSAIMNKKVQYKIRLQDILDFITFHSDKWMDIVSLTKIYLEQNPSNLEPVASLLNRIFVKRITFETQSLLIEMMIENFEEMAELLREQPFHLLHSLCCNYYQHLFDYESSLATSEEQLERNLKVLSENFKQMVQYLMSKGIHKPCKDMKIIESILSSRVKWFFKDNPYNNIPSTLVGTMNFLNFDLSATEIVDIASLIERNHFDCPQMMFYSSMKIDSAFANQQWVECFSYLCELFDKSHVSTSSKLFDFNISPLEEYSLTNFKNEFYSSLVVCFFERMKLLP